MSDELEDPRRNELVPPDEDEDGPLDLEAEDGAGEEPNELIPLTDRDDLIAEIEDLAGMTGDDKVDLGDAELVLMASGAFVIEQHGRTLPLRSASLELLSKIARRLKR